jgi:hypothetical protein
MALQRNYNIPNTSLIISGAYHIVGDIDVKKRNMDDMGPVSGSSEFNPGLDRDADPVYWKSGYTCKVMVDVYASKEARDTAKKPIATLGASDVKLEENLATNAAILGTSRIELLTIYSNYNWVNSVIKKFRELVSEPVATVAGTVPPTSNNSPTQNTVLGPAQHPPMELSQFVKTKLNSLMESFKLVQSNAVNLSFNNTSNQLNSRPQLQLSDNDVDNFTKDNSISSKTSKLKCVKMIKKRLTNFF